MLAQTWMFDRYGNPHSEIWVSAKLLPKKLQKFHPPHLVFSYITYYILHIPSTSTNSPWIDPLLRKALYHTATDAPPPSFAPISSPQAAHLQTKGVGGGASLYTFHLAMSSRMTMHPCTMLLRSPYDDDTVTSDRVAPRFSATHRSMSRNGIYMDSLNYL